MEDRTRVIEIAFSAILEGDEAHAKEVIRDRYPFVPPTVGGRNVSARTATRVFVQDGFIDRYSGSRLVFPPVLKVISRVLPTEFPFHAHWKMTECHIAFWELTAVVDHVVPIARGGTNEETNLITTSMLRNNAKANWTLEELGWRLLPPGDFRQWDGLMKWFLDYVAAHEDALQDQSVKRWHSAVPKFMQEKLKNPDAGQDVNDRLIAQP